MESPVYNIQGKSVGKISLPESIFGVSWNGDLVHQVLTSEMSNRRSPIAHTKTRGEVRGGGKKPWQQKGTGRARHGSTRSPIWVGGGVAHGPRNDKNFNRKINRKMKTKALFTLLARKNKEGEIIFVDSINFESPKTRLAKNFVDSLAKVKGFELLGGKKTNTAYIAMSEEESAMKRSFANFGNVQVGDIRNLNSLDVSKYKFLVITKPEEAVQFLSAKVKQASVEEEVPEKEASQEIKKEIKTEVKKVAPKKPVASSTKKSPAKPKEKKKPTE